MHVNNRQKPLWFLKKNHKIVIPNGLQGTQADRA